MPDTIKRLENLEVAVMVLASEISQLNPGVEYSMNQLDLKVRELRGDFTNLEAIDADA